ncbi:phage/plasmid primase, P4 family [Methylobacterium fujisawaense]|uniref:phage/plasmid primase, P4 family n=1 Tax=Methylobacterium fujisawaense TaxID=107400 RepID=UPI0031F5607E
MSAPRTIPPLPKPGTKFPALPAALDAMRAEARWLVWRWEPHPKSGKLTKVPFIADAPRFKAASSRPSTWRTFEVAVAAYEAGEAHGIGFALAGSTFGMFDLDDCRDPGTGEIATWAQAQVSRSGSYAEVTTSGTGLRIIGRATGPKVHRNQAVLGAEGGRIETYRSCERYVVVTGDHLPGSPDHLAELDAEIDSTVEWLDEAASLVGEANAPAADPEPSEPRAAQRRDLPSALMRLVECGVPEGQRSDQFMHAIGWFKDLGWEVAEIVELLTQHPAGIAEKYDGRLPEEVRRCWDKAKVKPRRARFAAPTDELVTEDSATIRFVELYADRLRFCHDHRAWFEWTGAAWRQNRVGVAFRWARELARELGRALGDDPKAKSVLGKTAFAAGVEKFARTDAAFAVTQEAWDANLWLLGTPGGTVDLRTGELREPDPADGVTKLTTVAPAQAPDCPRWLAFLDQATKADPEMIRLLRQLAGIALTGETREHILPFAFGDGGNGKGVLLNTLTRILGDYAVTATVDAFMASHGDKHSTDLAMLRGARLVTASETEEGRAWAEARIKSLTGGDPITARFMRCDNFTYVPQFLLFISGNNKPNLNSVDAAMRRRFIMLPFENKPLVTDPLLPQKLEAEWPGILRWMIEGCLDWQRNGLVRSERDKAATEEYFATQDAFGLWLAEECDCEPGNEFKTATSTELFNAWQSFARRSGETASSHKDFASRMEKRGFQKHKSHGTMVYRGLRIPVRSPFHEAAE